MWNAGLDGDLQVEVLPDLDELVLADIADQDGELGPTGRADFRCPKSRASSDGRRNTCLQFTRRSLEL